MYVHGFTIFILVLTALDIRTQLTDSCFTTCLVDTYVALSTNQQLMIDYSPVQFSSLVTCFCGLFDIHECMGVF